MVGVATGLLSGFFGVGGGILVVPALVFILRMETRRAAATSLAAVIPVAAAGLAGYAAEARVDLPVAVLVAAGAVAGSLAGTFLLHRISERALLWSFALLLGALAVRLLLPLPQPVGRGGLDPGVVALAVGLGVAAGGLSGLLGVGGGFLTVPGLVLFLSETSALAKGTSLLVILPTALTGTWRNRRAGLVDWGVATAVGLSGAATALPASRLALGLDEDLANGLFALLLLVVAARTIVTARSLIPAHDRVRESRAAR